MVGPGKWLNAVRWTAYGPEKRVLIFEGFELQLLPHFASKFTKFAILNFKMWQLFVVHPGTGTRLTIEIEDYTTQ